MNLNQIESWDQFVDLATRWTERGPNGPNIYRGQSDESWALVPSLTRIFQREGLGHEKAISIERIILHEFQNRYRDIDGHCNTLKLTDALSWWEVMQHHSVPTRLLDWSKSPYASLFFAASASPEKNGAFYIMDAGHLQWIQATRAKDPEDKPGWQAFQEINKSLNGSSHEKSMVVISAPFPTSRMNAQHSSFTLSTEIMEDHDVTADNITFGRCSNRIEVNPSILYKYIIPNSLKVELLKKLKGKGFTQDTLFPDSRIMDGDSEEFLKILEQVITENP